ncbi:uncharacterized protein [Choristoneura fumiferana]|uniref:uncharacterized protein n=1 Tax=Choristoneura fumiferana TaxID=7141 RepID=UPI003D1599C0
MWDSGVKVKEEAWEGVSAAAEREGLYADHEVKQELLVGPEVLQPQDVAFRLGPKFEVTVVKEELSDEELAGTGNGANSEESYSDERCQFAKDGNGKEQLLFRPCAVHLERILLDKEQHSGKNAATLKTKYPKLKENDAHIANSEKCMKY